jgi:hypothetical protein
MKNHLIVIIRPAVATEYDCNKLKEPLDGGFRIISQLAVGERVIYVLEKEL